MKILIDEKTEIVYVAAKEWMNKLVSNYTIMVLTLYLDFYVGIIFVQIMSSVRVLIPFIVL